MIFLHDHLALNSLSFNSELMFSAFTNKRMFLMVPLFLHLGFYTAFWVCSFLYFFFRIRFWSSVNTLFQVCVYPTTFMFTKSLSHHVYLPAVYSIVIGAGEVISEFRFDFVLQILTSFVTISVFNHKFYGLQKVQNLGKFIVVQNKPRSDLSRFTDKSGKDIHQIQKCCSGPVHKFHEQASGQLWSASNIPHVSRIESCRFCTSWILCTWASNVYAHWWWYTAIRTKVFVLLRYYLTHRHSQLTTIKAELLSRFDHRSRCTLGSNDKYIIAKISVRMSIHKCLQTVHFMWH